MTPESEYPLHLATPTPYLLVADQGEWHGLPMQLSAALDRPVQSVHSLHELMLHLHAPSGDTGPALLMIAAETCQPELLSTCRMLAPLQEQARLGIVLLLRQWPVDDETVAAMRQQEGVEVLPLHGEVLPLCVKRPLGLVAQALQERFGRLRQQESHARKMAEQRVIESRLSYLTRYDELTDLANRQSFEHVLGEAIEQGQRHGYAHALLYLDLDRFKLHNDAIGHTAGNTLLQHIANQLRRRLPPEYLLARLGSDEFAVLLQGTDEQEASATAEHLRQMVADIEPDACGTVYHVGVSIGLALIPPTGNATVSQALAHAEQACFVAKGRGGNCVHRFSNDDSALQHLREDMHWAEPIRTALAGNHLFLAFQPVLAVAEERITHYEALVRIPASLGGNDRSAQFMLAAERLGLARQVDQWVLDASIGVLARHPEISLGVNLSSHVFQERHLLPRIREHLQESGIDPARLTFEITETSTIMNFAETRRMVEQIRDLGCRFALDDFGSGFSSYHYLKHFPVDMLKIDGSFVSGMREDVRDKTIVKSMIDIGHCLDLEIVAEFVEDPDTLRQLVEMGINHVQGYLIGRPTSEPLVRAFSMEQVNKELP